LLQTVKASTRSAAKPPEEVEARAPRPGELIDVSASRQGSSFWEALRLPYSFSLFYFFHPVAAIVTYLMILVVLCCICCACCAGPNKHVDDRVRVMTASSRRMSAQASDFLAKMADNDDKGDTDWRESKQFLSKYKLGREIGQGAFSIVYDCEQLSSGEKFAVKMIDPVETPKETIEKEIEMLNLLAHPCIVRMTDVFYENVFVCLVLDLHIGGDLMHGSQRHWKNRGVIPLDVLQRLAGMMVRGVAWLHQYDIAHRDLKGENVLLSGQQIEDEDCRACLSDFGTAVVVKPGKSLHEVCGSPAYWAPEFYRLEYGVEVDIWALGVMFVGLVTCRQPFNNEHEVEHKEVKLPLRASKDCKAFVAEMLRKERKDRLTAKQCMAHEFLSANLAAEQGRQLRPAEEEDIPVMETRSTNLRETGANACVKQRRSLLVDRLEAAQEKRRTVGETSSPLNFKEDIDGCWASEVTEDVHGAEKKRYEWWTSAKADQAGFIKNAPGAGNRGGELQAAGRQEGCTEMQALHILRMLEEYNVNTANFGHRGAKKLSEFFKEVQNGESRLMLDATRPKNIVRVVDVVLLRLAHVDGGSITRYLINLSEKFPDGRERIELNNLPGGKKRPHENGRQTVERILSERLKLQGFGITFDFVNREYLEEDDESPNYPGVRTVYRKEIFEGLVGTKDPEKLATLGLLDSMQPLYTAQGDDRYIRTFAWRSEGGCYARGIRVMAPKQGEHVSPLVPLPVNYDEEELKALLEENHLDATAFANEKGKGSMAKLEEELQIGEAVLSRGPDGRWMRIVEVVVLKIMKQNGDILVQASSQSQGRDKGGARLPGCKRRQDENIFWAASRLMENMKINENLLKIDVPNMVMIDEQKPSEMYKNIPTIYRRRIIPAILIEE